MIVEKEGRKDLKLHHRFIIALSIILTIGLAGCSEAEVATNVGELEFTQELKIPELLEPTIKSDGTKHFSLTMQPGTTEFLPGKLTNTLGINGSYLGPTIRVSRGDQVSFDVVNNLEETSTLHWHGMLLPPEMDGGPHQMIEAGETWTPHWTIDQPAATTWFHPHLHGKTAQHVYFGLAGMFIIDDEDSEKLPSTYGVDDIPLIVQDKIFSEEGQLLENNDSPYGTMGDNILINGTYDPYLEVTASQVRFRLLNGSNARAYNFGFTDGREFQVVANDAGLLNEPITLDRIMLSPGERAEIVVEFEPGEETILRSYSGTAGIESGEFDLLKIIAASELTDSEPIPNELSSVPPIEVPENVHARQFKLTMENEINDQKMDMYRIDEVVTSGSKEIWEIHNFGPEHNFHIHDAAFRVLEVNGKEPREFERGRKDTVFIPHGGNVKLIVEFGNYSDMEYPLMYHCHILKHEDEGMMGQFLLVEPGKESEAPTELPKGDNEQHEH